jgi:Mn-dependent DtxR family transcriptional regulator
MKIIFRPVKDQMSLRVLEAVIVLARFGTVTMQKIQDHLDYQCPSGITAILKNLKRLGLVSWEDKKKATLRPTVAFIPVRSKR